jgi:hypothetical protein
MEMSQGNSLCSYSKQTKLLFFFYKIAEERNRSCPGGRVDTSAGDKGRGRM